MLAAQPAEGPEKNEVSSDMRLAIGVVFVGIPFLLSCSAHTGLASLDGSVVRTSGSIRFEVYEGAMCGDAGPSPVGRCSHENYTGGLSGSGDTAIQRLEPVAPDGMFFVTENEVLRLPDGELRSLVNAVFHSKSPDLEVASLHTITGGTGRYADASGHIQLWRADGELFEYVAVVRLKASSVSP
jgi:hypothetical protein